MDKVLLDTSTFLDIRKASRKIDQGWAQNTLRHFLDYQRHHSKLTISGFTIFEFVDGLYRDAKTSAVQEFYKSLLPTLEIIFPDQRITDLAAEINAKLSSTGQIIGVVDTFISATALVQGLPLVNANAKHFSRVFDAGFPILLENWRDA